MSAEERLAERRADNRELSGRVAKMEETLKDMAERAANRDSKIDDLLIMVGSGKIAVRLLFWLGSAVVVFISAWQWLNDLFTLRP